MVERRGWFHWKILLKKYSVVGIYDEDDEDDFEEFSEDSIIPCRNDDDGDDSNHGFLQKEEVENAEIIGKTISSSASEAISIERMVEDNEKKRSAVKEMIAELNQINEQQS